MQELNTNIEIRRGDDLMGDDEEKVYSIEFQELINTYPKKTPNSRRLHSNKEDCFKKYTKLVARNPKLHKEVIKAIKLELQERLTNKSLNFLRMLSTYINQNGWEEYLEEDKPIEGDIGYGNTLK